jgi:hypothetical protein
MSQRNKDTMEGIAKSMEDVNDVCGDNKTAVSPADTEAPVSFKFNAVVKQPSPNRDRDMKAAASKRGYG